MGKFLDLKPENLLFRTTDEDADIMLADFGLSRIMEEEKLNMLTEICGTPGVSFRCFLFFALFFDKEKTLFSDLGFAYCSIWRQRFSKKVGCGQHLVVLFLAAHRFMAIN